MDEEEIEDGERSSRTGKGGTWDKIVMEIFFIYFVL